MARSCTSIDTTAATPGSFRCRCLAVMSNSSSFRVTPNGQYGIFFGKPVDDQNGQDHLYAVELTSEKMTRLAPDVSFDVGLNDLFPLSSSADSQAALVRLPAGNLHRLVSI